MFEDEKTKKEFTHYAFRVQFCSLNQFLEWKFSQTISIIHILFHKYLLNHYLNNNFKFKLLSHQ